MGLGKGGAGGDSGHEEARSGRVGFGDQNGDLTLVSHAEGVDGVGEPGAEHAGDLLALEEPLQHQGFRLVAAAADLHEGVFVFHAPDLGSQREADDFASTSHAPRVTRPAGPRNPTPALTPLPAPG